MRVRNQSYGFLSVILICLAVGGCASTGAPDDWLSVAEDAPQDPYGAWMTVEFVKSYDKKFLKGEFLAIDSDSLYVLNSVAGAGDPVISVPLDIIKKARIASFNPETGKVTGWVAAGALSTLSHGMVAAATMPLWIIFGSAIAGGQSRTALEHYPDHAWDELNMYARFPQGPPPGLHQLGLLPKPLLSPYSLKETSPPHAVY